MVEDIRRLKDEQIQERYPLIAEARLFFKGLKAIDKEKIRLEKVFYLSYKDLEKHSPDLAKRIFEFPEETLEALEVALDELVKDALARVRLIEIPDSKAIRIEDLRAKHLNKLILIDGYLVQASDVRPQVVTAKFECPKDGTIISVLQIEKKFREPTRCSCGYRGNFRLVSKDMVDAQRIIISQGREMQEIEDGVIVPTESHLSVFIQEDLTQPDKNIIERLGQKIKAIGILKEVPVPLQTGSTSTRFDLALETNNLFFEKEDGAIIITKDEEKRILKMAKDPAILEKLAMSVSPTVWGYQEIKKALVLQLFGASRGSINTLIIGDPGVGKVSTLKSISNLALNGEYIDGILMSDEEITRDLNSKAVMRISQNKKFIAISSLNSIDFFEGEVVKLIKKKMNEGISLLASGISKFGRFEPFQTIAQQIDIPPQIINKFDLIFIIRDIPDKYKDEAVANAILSKNSSKSIPAINKDLFQKYMVYAKSRINPTLTSEAIKVLKDFYVKLRNVPSADDSLGVKSIPISARQLDVLAKIAEAHARVRLSNKVTKDDAKVAIDILKYYLFQVGYDCETKSFDIDRIEGISTSERKNVALILETLIKLEDKLGKFIPQEELEDELEDKVSKNDIESTLQKLLASGDIFFPRKGFIQRI